MWPYQLALLITAALLVALLGLGLRLQLARGPARPTYVRWPHHALFFAVCAGLLLSLWLCWRAGGRYQGLLPALALLLLMPRTRPGRAGHWRLALAAALAYFAGMWWVW